MSDRFDHDVFLSHSSKDKAVVRLIAERLRTDGLRVWFDEWEIKAGDSIPAKTEEGLEHSRVLVLCLSDNAFGSDWGRLEGETLRFREPLNDAPRYPDPFNRSRQLLLLWLEHESFDGFMEGYLNIDWRQEYREAAYPRFLSVCQPPVEMPVPKDPSQERHVQLDLEPKKEIRTCAFTLDGEHVLTGALDSNVRLWDVESGRCLRVLEGHIGWAQSLAWDADERLALSGSYDRTVRLWDVESGRCLRVLDGHTSYINCVAWSADQRWALSGGRDGTVRLWDVETGHCVRVLRGHAATVIGVAWAAEPRRAFSADQSGDIRVWDLPVK